MYYICFPLINLCITNLIRSNWRWVNRTWQAGCSIFNTCREQIGIAQQLKNKTLLPWSWCVHKPLLAVQLWRTTASRLCVAVTLLRFQQKDEVQQNYQSINVAPSWNMCCVPIACLRSHRPTNPCRLHAHLPIHCTGNQFPRQPQSPCVCLSVKTNLGSHFTCAAVCYFYASIHSRIHLHICLSLCVIKPGDQTGTLQVSSETNLTDKMMEQTRTDKAATVFHLHKVGHVQWKNLIENIFK